MSTWYGDAPPPAFQPIRGLAWIRVVCRGLPIAIVVFGGLLVLLTLRIFERPIWGERRPVTPYITTFVCRMTLRFLGLSYTVKGRPMTGVGAQVANHASWLDIFVLNACQQVYFVSKAEVAGWPGIGWLARATGTVFITRNRSDAQAQTDQFRARTLSGHRLLFFPEGTSSDSLRVLPFKPTLFAAFFAPDLVSITRVQPVSVVYRAPEGAAPRIYGWWGDMEFAAHFLQILALPRQGAVTVEFHTPLLMSESVNRKVLAARCEATISASVQAVHDISSITASTDIPSER